MNNSSPAYSQQTANTFELDPAYTTQESLALTLTLTIAGQTFTIPGANIKQCNLSVKSCGFESSLGFYLPSDQREDILVDAFVEQDLINVELAIAAVHNLPSPEPEPLTVKGLVSEKSLTETGYRQVSGAPVFYRYYQISFADPAQVLWKQHYPCELYVDGCMTNVINAQVVAPISLSIDFPPADTVLPLICLALGNTESLHFGETGTTNRASFYDFLMTYAHDTNAIFSYDYSSQTYSLTAQEPELTSGTAFLPHEIQHVQYHWPATKRSVTNLLNVTADNHNQVALENTQAVDGIKHDVALRLGIEDQFTEQQDRQTNRLVPTGTQIQLAFSQWPMQDFWPNCEISFDSEVDGEHFLHTSQSFRCHALDLKMQALDCSPEKDIDLTFTQYQLSYQALGHQSTQPQPIFPTYLLPRYPLYVEGVIVSEQGEDDEKTFDVPSNEDTGQFEYKVNIPLWDLTIKVLLEPDFLNSHFYFPFYRDTKLLLGFDLYRAHIVKVLNWGEGVQLPMATQGNHILFGKNTEDQTSMSHQYEDGLPVLAIKRNKENDTELVRLEEGSIILQTCEED